MATLHSFADHTTGPEGRPRVVEVLGEARSLLHGSPSASLDSQLLLGLVLKRNRAWLLAHGDEFVAPKPLELFWALVCRRQRGEPVAYLRGRVDWLDLELEVSPDVLIPRPETELLAEHAIRLGRRLSVRTAADIGTGSGALAIALARGLPDAAVEATDVSTRALEVTARNLARYELGNRIRLSPGNLVEPLDGPPQLLVANLPYLSDGMMADLDDNVRHEPPLALHGGHSGLELYAALLEQITDRGWSCPLFLEIDPRQTDAMLSLLSALPTGTRQVLPDLSGRPRVAHYLPRGIYGA